MTDEDLKEQLKPLYWQLHQSAQPPVQDNGDFDAHNAKVRSICSGAFTLCDGGASPDKQEQFDLMPHIFLMGGSTKIGNSIDALLDPEMLSDIVLNVLAAQVGINGQIIDILEEYKGGAH